jgi:hypothetical protein
MALVLQSSIFVATGILSTLTAQVLLYAGAGDSWTALLPLSNYLGMALAAAVPLSWIGGAPPATPSSPASRSSESPCGSNDGDASKSPRAARSGVLGGWFDVPRESVPPGAPPPAPGSITVSVPVYVCSAVLLDICGFWLHVQGIKYAGSALFQVIYASVTVFAAVGSWAAHTTTGARALVGVGVAVWLVEPSAAAPAAPRSKHGLNALQMLGIAVVLSGLGYAALAEGPARAHDHHELTGGSETAAGGVGAAGAVGALPLGTAWGLLASVLCALCYGVVYVLAELLMSAPAPPRAHAIANRVGVGICSVLLSYIVVAVLPRAGEVGVHIAEAGLLSARGVLVGYGVMVLSAVAHSITYFQLLGAAGSVATGVMSAARAVGVFIFSALLFCRAPGAKLASALAPMLHESQCLTRERMVATALVCGGIVVFSVGKAKK